MNTRVWRIFAAWLLTAGSALSQSNGDLPEAPKPGTKYSNSIGMELVYVAPAKFLMGSPDGDPGHFDDEQQHPVEITRGFYVGCHEVTQEQYKKVVGKNPSLFRGSNLPVESVDWKTAVEFCRLLSLAEGRGDKDGQGPGSYRLPTEAEWELACRAGTTTPYCFGETITPKHANFAFHHVRKNGTTEVGSFPPNAWGAVRHVRQCVGVVPGQLCAGHSREQ